MARPGDRAPDVAGGRRLCDVLRGPQWTVLVFGAATPARP
ncbi:hypothetical protein HNR73_006900 [Phytomonospora endophytica]|uniref:Uncharacterized protein n=1 Tax=Phytomonospora endophytica TaxID=714109 RepID=A0A841FNW4_9ACTN|nr:hypothetical protein [Phytomonospora endophytica]